MTVFATIFPKSAFVRHVTTLAAGTAIGQILTVLVSPVLTRLYGPEALGIFGVFSAVAGIVAIIATSQLYMAAVLPKRERDGISLIVLAFIFAMVTFTLCLSASIVFRGSLALLLGFGDYENILWMLAFLMFGTSSVRILSHWALRSQKFFFLSLSSIAAAVVSSAFKVGAGLLGYGVTALLLGGIIGYFFQSACLAFVLPKTIIHSRPSSEGWACIQRVASTHIDFAFYRTPQITLNAFSSNLPGILFAALFGPAAAGFYFIAYRVLQMPGQLIADAVKKAFYPKAAKIVNANGDLRSAVVKATLMLAVVGAVPLIVVLVFGPFLFSFAFGKQWVLAGDYARWLSLWTFAVFMNGPSVSAIPVIGKQAAFLFYEIVYSIAKAIAIAGTALLTRDALTAIAAYAVVGLIANSFLILYTISCCPKPLADKHPVTKQLLNEETSLSGIRKQ